MLVRMWRNWTLVHGWWGCKMVWQLWNNSTAILKKTKRIIVGSGNSTSGYLPKRFESGVSNILVHDSRKVEATHTSIDG